MSVLEEGKGGKGGGEGERWITGLNGPVNKCGVANRGRGEKKENRIKTAKTLAGPPERAAGGEEKRKVIPSRKGRKKKERKQPLKDQDRLRPSLPYWGGGGGGRGGKLYRRKKKKGRFFRLGPPPRSKKKGGGKTYYCQREEG